MKQNQTTRDYMGATGSVLCSIFIFINSAVAQGTAFTYQGQLQNRGAAASGNYDFTFALYNSSATNSPQVGTTLTNLDVGVTNGLFTVALDFGPVFTGNPTWLSIEVRTNGAMNFTALSPLQELTPAPYAVYAANAATVTGPISVSQLPAAVITNGDTNVSLSGSFSGDGKNLTNIDTTSLVSATVAQYPSFTNVYSTNGTYTFVIPPGITQMAVKLWGAGGEEAKIDGLPWDGGGGGAFSEVVESVTPGQIYVVVVGQSGGAGGGAGANDASGGLGNSSEIVAGDGGQGSSLFLYNAPNYIMQAVAGGGGGGGSLFGGLAGQANGSGSGYASMATTTGVTNLDLIGGDGGFGTSGEGGCGGGYGGGASQESGAAGGGSYGNVTVSGSGSSAGNTNDPNYQEGSAFGNQDGLIVVTLNSILNFAESVQAPGFLGNGNGLTNLNSTNLTGILPLATLAAVLTNTTGWYTPAIGDGIHNFTTGTDSGYYAKSGNLVYFEAWMTWTSKGSASGNLVISLPFTNASSRPAFNFAYMSGITNATQIVGNSLPGNTNFTVAFTSPTGGGVAPIQAASCANSGEIQVTGTYRWQ